MTAEPETTVYVIADNDRDDLVYRIFAVGLPPSPVYRQRKKAANRDMSRSLGNPYLIYGEDIAAYLGTETWNYTVVVAHVTCGVLVPNTGNDADDDREPIAEGDYRYYRTPGAVDR